MKKIYVIMATIGLLSVVSFKTVSAQFIASAQANNNIFSTAKVFSSPSPSPSASPCDSITLSGNGDGSKNTVIQKCERETTIDQSQNTSGTISVNALSDTGNNSLNNNTGLNVQTGSASATVNINISSN